MRKRTDLIKVLCAVIALTTVLALTSCSCTSCSNSGLGALGNLIGGGTTVAEPSTEATSGSVSETTTTKPTTPATSSTEPTTKKEDSVTTTTAETTTAHTHDWKYNGEEAATCTEDGKHWYICSECGAEYYDSIPALGHSWERNGGSPPDCIYDGGKWYICTRCWEEYVEVLPAVGHDWDLVYHCDPGCEYSGYDTYQCLRCGAVQNMDYDEYPPLGHNQNGTMPDWSGGYADMGHINYCDNCGLEYPETFDPHTWACKPKEGQETIYHMYYCYLCGYAYDDIHHMNSDGVCVDCGYSGPVG